MEFKPPSKISLIALLIAGPSISFNAYGLSGFNVGVGAGYEGFQSNIATQFSENGLTYTSSGQPIIYGGIGNVFVGYGWTLGEWFYIGGELGANIYSQNSVTLSGSASANTVATGFDPIVSDGQGSITFAEVLRTKVTVSRRAIEPTLDLKLGALITPRFLMYGRVGIAENRIKTTASSSYAESGQSMLKTNFSSVVFVTQAEATNNFSQTSSTNTIIWRAGLGLTGMLTPNVGLSVDYNYSFYNNSKVNQDPFANQVTCDFIEGCSVNPDGKYSSHNHTKNISSHHVMLGLIYYLQNVC